MEIVIDPGVSGLMLFLRVHERCHDLHHAFEVVHKVGVQYLVVREPAISKIADSLLFNHSDTLELEEVNVLVVLVYSLGRDFEHIRVAKDIPPFARTSWLGLSEHGDKLRAGNNVSEWLGVLQQSFTDTVELGLLRLPHATGEEGVPWLKVEMVACPYPPPT